jgi:hypothetical protein
MVEGFTPSFIIMTLISSSAGVVNIPSRIFSLLGRTHLSHRQTRAFLLLSEIKGPPGCNLIKTRAQTLVSGKFRESLIIITIQHVPLLFLFFLSFALLLLMTMILSNGKKQT